MATTEDKYAITSNVGVIARLTEILADINLRLIQAESRYGASDRAAQEVAAQGIRYLETVIVPAATKVADLLRSVTDIFVTKSSTSITPSVGTKTFIVEDMTFGSLGNVSITKTGDVDTGMYGPVVSFDPNTKTLVVDVRYVYGSPDTNASWDISAALPYDAHVGRTDNPHETTAHQVGAYTQGEIDAALSALNSAVRSSFAAADSAIRTDFGAADAAIRTDFAAADVANRAASQNDTIALILALA